MEDREYYVFPVVILVEGVHHGSTGPILYKRSDLRLYASAWDHKPVVINHPKKKGIYVSANSPDILSESKVGILLANRVDGYRQRAEAWLEKERIEERSPETLKALRRGSAIEVSTGLFSSLEEKHGYWNGEEYEGIAREFRPDHLAILPNTTGACSVKDGCGMRSNCSCKKGKSMKTKGTKLSRLKKKKLVNSIIQANDEWEEKDRKWLMTLQDCKLKKLAAISNQDDDEENDDEEEGTVNKKKKTKKMGRKVQGYDDDEEKPKTNKKGKKKKKKTPSALEKEADKYLKEAPAPIRALLKHGLSAYEAEVARLTDIILSNEENEFDEEELAAFELPMLKKLASLAISNSDNEDDDEDEAPEWNFAGAVGANRSSSKVKEAALEHPTMNFDEEDNKSKK
jgi:hypothetical protein